ncbi:MAG: hypothetical protein P8100_12905, partial [bacterium]
PVTGVTDQESYFVKALYDVLLEFDKTEEFGDLNSNTIEEDLVIYEHAPDPVIEGLTFAVKIEFPRWDDENVEWDDLISIQANIKSITVTIFELPDNYQMEAIISNKKEVILTGSKDIGGSVTPIDGIDLLMDTVNDFIYDTSEGLLQLYIEKVEKIHEIVAKVSATLHENRNLCDDYFRFHALKIEEIILCADIELEASADIDLVEATMYKNIADFLSPQVTFYTLEEMRTKCEDFPQYTISEIRKSKHTFIIDRKLEEDLNVDDTISVIGAGEDDDQYTVKCIRANRENPDFTDIEIVEDIPTNDFGEGAFLIRGTIDENACLTVDKIFEGPLLKHGFIDDEELELAKRRKVIHVSDLIRIIMDIEGVIAVKSIQIANRPQDNVDGIESKSVKWCLELAMEHNYVPRLNIDDSKVTYFKDQLPFLADREEVQTLIDEMEAADRPQKIRYPVMDIPIPAGEFKEIEQYTSVQEEFPLFFGIGVEGIPGLSSLEGAERQQRLSEVYQLKEYLLFFDQLLANYLSQLAHVKELFSMNGERDEFGQYLIDRTYFTQPLFDIIPNSDPLYVDKGGHTVALQQLTEDKALYEKRRNKFLDHLLGRFAETFADYAMLSYKMSGKKAAADLIEDKLRFLDKYPELSSRRGLGMNYFDPCEIWHSDNVSGLEKRVSLLSGIQERLAGELRFSDNFVIVAPATSGDPYQLQINNDAAVTLFVADMLETEDDARLAAEKIIVNGVTKDNYLIIDTDSGFAVILSCAENILAVSDRSDFASDAPGGDADLMIDEMIALMEREFYNNPLSNRNNLTCPLLNFFDVEVSADMSPVAPDPPTYTIAFTLYREAFDFNPGGELLTGSVTEDAEAGDSEPEVLGKANDRIYDVLWNVINNGSARGHYVFDPPEAPFSSPYHFLVTDRFGDEIARSVEADFNDRIADEAANLVSGVVTVSGSTDNDGDYTVTSASASGPFVTLQVSPSPTPPVFDGQLSWTENFSITAVDRTNRTFEVAQDITAVRRKGDTIRVESSDSNDGTYTILKLETDGSSTTIYVKEVIPA